MAKVVCLGKDCPVLVDSGYCAACRRPVQQQKDDARRDLPYRALYRTSRWKRCSRARLARFPWCALCAAKGIRTLATCTDHIQPASQCPELFFEETNHQSACDACNAAKGDR